MSLIGNFNPPAEKGETLPGLCKAQPVESIHIKSVMDIADGYDVFLFSSENTLSVNDQTLPCAAVLIPKLRQMGKKVAIFSVDQKLDKDALVDKVNYLGLSFTRNSIIVLDDFEHLLAKYPLTPKHRILMVSPNLLEEIALGKALNLTTLLINRGEKKDSEHLGIWPHFITKEL